MLLEKPVISFYMAQYRYNICILDMSCGDWAYVDKLYFYVHINCVFLSYIYTDGITMKTYIPYNTYAQSEQVKK